MKVKLLILCMLKLVSCYGVRKDEARIVGGIYTEDSHVPYAYMCSIQMKGMNFHICGGSIISSEWILTAAHCLGQSPFEIQLVVGTNDIHSGGQIYYVDYTIQHPQYSQDERHLNDIGLIHPYGLIEFNENVQPIKYATREVKPGTKLLSIGWGRTSATGEGTTRLQKVTLETISHKKCKKAFPQITPNVLCTSTIKGATAVGVCMGDSGGPLVLGDTLVGLVSFGSPCAIGMPDVFTEVSKYVQWIKSITDPVILGVWETTFN